MIRKFPSLIFMIMVFLTSGCIKDTYDMNKLSKRIHLSPAINIAAIKGDISLSDMVSSNDTIVFDQDNFVRLIFKEDSLIDLALSDFSALKNKSGLYERELVLPETDYRKATLSQLVATIEADSIDLEIEDILSNISGDVHIANPILRLNYTNSFLNPVQITFLATGIRAGTTVDLNLAPFTLSYPADEIEHQVSDVYIIDKNNSALSDLISLLPEKVYFSGSALLDVPVGKSLKDEPVIDSDHLYGSLEIEVPLDLSLSNFEFADTVDNFLDDAFESDSDFDWDDFELFKVDFKVKNGFPMGVSLTMGLYDSLNMQIISSVDASDILDPAPVDGNGKASGTAETTTSIEFTKEFFSSIKLADKIIFKFTLNTTGNGSTDVKIYSDYRIDFNASLVMKADINFN
jgi:hypothetical protein